MNDLQTGGTKLDEASICAACGGICCKHMGGTVSPDDLARPLVATVTAMLLADYVVDWWEGDTKAGGRLGRVMFLRAANIGGSWPTDPSWHGVCVFLGDSGCKLSLAIRPRQCQMLHPKSAKLGEEGCEGQSKHDAAAAWRPHQQAIRQALEAVDVEASE